MRTPTLDDSHWKPVRLLLQAVDGQISEVYAKHNLQDIPPRYSMVLIHLHSHGPSSIKDLATALDVSHSAMSQTTTKMRKDGFVQSAPGSDARTRLIEVTERGAQVVPFLEAEWWATEAALKQLDDEVGVGLRQAAQALHQALARKPFAERITEHLKT